MRSFVTGSKAIYNDWDSPWQFQLHIRNQRVRFSRHSWSDDDCYEWFSITSSVKVSSNIWTHVAVTWDHATGYSAIYVDGKNVGYRTYSPRTLFFYPPTGKPYKIGNDGHWNDNQFYGSVMDLYVFGTALSLDEINKLRGWCLIRRYKYKSMVMILTLRDDMSEINRNLNHWF